MMKRILGATCLAYLCACTPQGTVTSNVTPTTTCQAVASVEASPIYTQQIQPAIASNNALGQVFSYLGSGCNGNQPAAGVNASWTQEILTMAEDALPAIIPIVVGAL